MSESRTKKSMINSIVAMLFYVLSLVLSFFSRKVFLNYLGTEVLGLNTTATNLLQFLNLAELGIGAAVGFSLYKPLWNNNEEEINEIVTLQGILYRRIAYVVLSGAAILMLFFPIIFSKMELPLWYAYGSFAVLLLSSMLGYFVNYKQIVLSAAQLNYKILLSSKTWYILKVILQMLAISAFPHPYVWWLILEAIFAVIICASIEYTTLHTFPFLKSKGLNYIYLKNKYPTIIVKIKQVFFHKIGGVALNQSSPFIIYAYLSLSMVALYGNYMIIINGVSMLFNAVFSGMGAGIGNLVAENNKEKIVSVFKELFSTRFFVIVILCFAIYISASPFVTLWIGEEYVLSDVTLLLMIATLYITLSRLTVDAYIEAYGLFQDVAAPVIEASLNVGCSILLGYYWGLNGILAGVLVSLLSVVFLWKPFFLFRCGLKLPISEYIALYFKHIIAFSVTILIWSQVKKIITINPLDGWIYLIIYSLINVAFVGIMLLIVMLSLRCDMKRTIIRLQRLIKIQ